MRHPKDRTPIARAKSTPGKTVPAVSELNLLEYTFDSIFRTDTAYFTVEFVNLYKCLADSQRLRILNLLREGPLCVCHLQEILQETQVKTSKQLAYMKRLGVVTATREGAWMIYRLPEAAPPVLVQNLECLRDSAGGHPFLSNDLERRRELMARIQREGSGCPGVVVEGDWPWK